MDSLFQRDCLTESWWPPLRALQAPPVFRGGFEFDLKRGTLDVQQCLSRRPEDQKYAGECPLQIVRDWSLSSSTGVPHLWLEVDHDSPRQAAFFLSIDNASKPEMVYRKLLKLPVNETVRELLQENRLSYLGFMTQRPRQPSRFNFSLPVPEVVPFLKDRKWSGCYRTLERKLDIARRWNYRVTISLELLSDVLSPRVGVEFKCGSRHWNDVWSLGVQQGWLSERDRDLLLRWDGDVIGREWLWPLPLALRFLQRPSEVLGLFTSVSHLKWQISDNGEESVKVYLWLAEEWNHASRAELVKGQKKAGGGVSPPSRLLEELFEVVALSQLETLEERWGPGRLRAALSVIQTMRLARFQRSDLSNDDR